MMKRLVFLLIMLFALFSLIGCGGGGGDGGGGSVDVSESTLVGTWDLAESGGQPANGLTLVFNSDHSGQAEYSVGATESFIWSLNSDLLTLRVSSGGSTIDQGVVDFPSAREMTITNGSNTNRYDKQ